MQLEDLGVHVAAHVALNALRARRRARNVFDPTELSAAPHNRCVGDAEQDVCARDELRAVQTHLTAMKSSTRWRSSSTMSSVTISPKSPK